MCILNLVMAHSLHIFSQETLHYVPACGSCGTAESAAEEAAREPCLMSVGSCGHPKCWLTLFFDDEQGTVSVRKTHRNTEIALPKPKNTNNKAMGEMV